MILKIIQDGSTSIHDTILEMCGIKLLRNGQVQKNFFLKKKRKVKGTFAEMHQFVTFALDSMKLSTVQRKKEQRDWKKGSRQDTDGRESLYEAYQVYKEARDTLNQV